MTICEHSSFRREPDELLGREQVATLLNPAFLVRFRCGCGFVFMVAGDARTGRVVDVWPPLLIVVYDLRTEPPAAGRAGPQ